MIDKFKPISVTLFSKKSDRGGSRFHQSHIAAIIGMILIIVSIAHIHYPHHGRKPIDFMIYSYLASFIIYLLRPQRLYRQLTNNSSISWNLAYALHPSPYNDDHIFYPHIRVNDLSFNRPALIVNISFTAYITCYNTSYLSDYNLS